MTDSSWTVLIAPPLARRLDIPPRHIEASVHAVARAGHLYSASSASPSGASEHADERQQSGVPVSSAGAGDITPTNGRVHRTKNDLQLAQSYSEGYCWSLHVLLLVKALGLLGGVALVLSGFANTRLMITNLEEPNFLKICPGNFLFYSTILDRAEVCTAGETAIGPDHLLPSIQHFYHQTTDEAQSDELSLRAKSWVGRRFVRIGEEYNGRDAVVREIEFAKPYRVFRPGQMLGDLSFDPDRLNIFLDGNSIIVDVTRG